MEESSIRLPRRLRQFLQQSFMWTLLCFASEGIARFALHLGYPYDYPAVPAFLIFGDFRLWIDKFKYFHSAQFFHAGSPLMYPTPVVVFYELFLLMPGKNWNTVYLTLRFVGIIFLVCCIMLIVFRNSLVKRGLKRSSATTFALCLLALSFPFWFEVHQANMEFVVWVIVTGGIWFFWNDNPWMAATLFGMAIAMKFFPAVFLCLLLVRKQYRQACFSLVVAAFVTLGSLWLVCPDIKYSWKATNNAVNQFRAAYMLQLRPMESGFDHSLFCLFKRLLPTLPAPGRVSHMLMIYLILATVGGLLVFVYRIRKLPVVNQVLCLSIAAILLPPTSYDYTLLHLYAPFALLVFVVIEQAKGAKQVSKHNGVLAAAFCLFAFLVSSQSEFIAAGLRYAGQLKAVALTCLLVVALKYPFELSRNVSLPSRSDISPTKI